MADDISTLQVRVQSAGVTSTTQQLKGLANQSAKTETATGGLIKKLAVMAGTYITVAAAVRGFMAVIQQVRTYEVMRASVTTATGSLEKMELAWKSLIKFAATTPFELGESVTAFTRMINYGLNPSERALRSFGDTAAAMQYQLGDMVEAVAKASAGEFEPLRKFAITAKKDGEDITFSFKGVKTTVKNSIDEIQEYFTKLGEENFAGSMENRMKTLDGAFSNLGDSWDQFKYKLGTSTGVGEAFRGVLLDITEAVDDLGKAVESGEVEARITQQMEQWGALGGTIKDLFTQATDAARDFTDDASTESSEWDDYWSSAFLNFPANLNYAVKSGVAHLQWFVSASQEMANDFGAGWDKASSSLAMKAAAALHAARYVGSSQGGGKSYTDHYNEGMAKIQQGQSDKARDAALAGGYSPLGGGVPVDPIKRANAELESTLDALRDENAAALRRSAELIGGVLPEMGDIGGGSGDTITLDPLTVAAPKNKFSGEINGEGKKGKKRGAGELTDFQQVLKDLQTEETAISESYARRLAIIQLNTEETSALRAQASLRALDIYEEEQLREIERDKQNLDTRWDAMEREEDLIRSSYERRKQIILEATELTEAERAKLMEEAQRKYLQNLARHHQEETGVYLDNAQSFFSNLSKLSSSNNKTMFKVAQAAAIANATIDMFRAAQRAYADGGPYAGPVMAAAAFAAGAANIAAIKSQQFSGSYAEGGIIPGTSFSGDRLTANVNSGEMVLNKSQQAKLFEIANGGKNGGGSNTVVNITSYGAPVEEKRTKTGDQEIIDIIVGRAAAKVAEDIQKGGTSVAKAMESTFNLTRGKGAGRR